MSYINDLKKFICKQPFEYLDVQENGDYVCCPSWCKTNIRDNNENLLLIRKSVLNGSYSYCDHSICPYINNFLATGEKPDIFYTKKEFYDKYKIYNEHDLDNLKNNSIKPIEILFGWDRSCNLMCPSCRSKKIINSPNNSHEYHNKNKILKNIENNFGEKAKRFFITGSGDPFFSKIYRDFLIKFDKSKYPNLEGINIITNGILLNKKMWNKMKASPYIDSIEISIDAGSKETYKKTRIGGDWEMLIKNLKFLSTLTTIKQFIFSMVVSKLNYKEMDIFYNLIMGIFNKSSANIHINFRQLVYWETGVYDITEIDELQVFKEDNNLYEDFKKELLKINDYPNQNHDFNHLLINNNNNLL